MMWLFHAVFIHLLKDIGFVANFLALVNRAAVNILHLRLSGDLCFISLGGVFVSGISFSE